MFLFVCCRNYWTVSGIREAARAVNITLMKLINNENEEVEK